DNLLLSGLLTAGNGFIATGSAEINTSGTADTTIGNTAGGTITIGATSGSNLILNDAQWNISGAGAANFASIGATTPGTGAFTTLSSTGATTLGDNSSTVAIDSSIWDITSAGVISGITGYSQGSGTFTVNGSGAVSLGTGTNNVTIGNGTGTLAIASNGGLNVTTGGALTGVSSIDTITTTATSLGFAGSGTITSAAGNGLTFTSG